MSGNFDCHYSGMTTASVFFSYGLKKFLPPIITRINISKKVNKIEYTTRLV